MSEVEGKSGYEAPALKVAGTLHENTLRGKDFGKPNDGDFIHHKSLTTVS